MPNHFAVIRKGWGELRRHSIEHSTPAHNFLEATGHA